MQYGKIRAGKQGMLGVGSVDFVLLHGVAREGLR